MSPQSHFAMAISREGCVEPGRLHRCLQGDTVEQLLPLFLTLLKDEWPDVRLAIIGKLQAVNQVRSCACWDATRKALPGRMVSCTPAMAHLLSILFAAGHWHRAACSDPAAGC